MAITDRVERERVTEVARERLTLLRTMLDLHAWYGDYFAQLGAKILGKLINDDHLRLEAEKRETARRLKVLRDTRNAREDAFAYSPKNMAKQGRTQTKEPSEWKRAHDAAVQDAKDLEEEDRQANEITFSEGEGQRGQNYPGERA